LWPLVTPITIITNDPLRDGWRWPDATATGGEEDLFLVVGIELAGVQVALGC